jgi:AcrR family transcriptional regulator
MPRLIDYADRFEAVREVVYEITLEHGVGAVTLEAVAARLFMSPRTVSRLIRSVEVLPLLGLQHAEGRERRRLLRRAAHASRTSRPRSQQALEDLLVQIPGSGDSADRHVWWLLVRAHAATAEWAGAALAERERAIAMLCDEALQDISCEKTRALEATRLRLLVSGAITQVCQAAVDPADALACIRSHVQDVLGQTRATMTLPDQLFRTTPT